MNTNKSPIELACDAVGSQAEMARILEVTPAMINQLMKGARPVPVEHCYAIEVASKGAVTRRDLRPDDWQKIWPELASTPESGVAPPKDNRRHTESHPVVIIPDRRAHFEPRPKQPKKRKGG